jgi:hypothetical protein
MEGLEDLVGELLDYPHAEHDDLMDALAYAVFLANPASVTQQDRINEWDYDVEGNLILSSDSVMDALEKKHAGLSANELVERAWQPMGGSNEWS